jgi:hypothetical protein
MDPNGVSSLLGATMASPERAVISSPVPGVWTALVNGFTIHSGDRGTSDPTDNFSLRVKIDGIYLP